ncbi:MAG: permease prefix domain 2-containing transporter, partial [Bacteroidota bacterium]
MKKKKPLPPKSAQRFLNWFLKRSLTEEILGDLEEKFVQELKEKSPWRAKVTYWYQTFHYLRPFAIKEKLITDLIPFFMFRNHLKLTFRLFAKNKTYLLINALGLGIAVACCLAAYLFIAHNIEFDSMHRPEKVANIYKIHAQQESKTGQFSENMTIAAPLAPMAALDIPGINRFTRYIPNN